MIDPLFHIALEEELLRFSNTSWILLYRNSDAILIGRHQNPLEEVNFPYCAAEKIPWYRRLSGGGAVFHDLGNLNISFIVPFSSALYNNYTPFLTPLCTFLTTHLGLSISKNRRNALQLNGKKISGSAQFTTHRRLLCHSTLLVQSNLERLDKSLQPVAKVINSRAVPSVRAEVTNIATFVPTTPEELQEALAKHLQQEFHADFFPFDLLPIDRIEKKRADFLHPEWRFERTPRCTVMVTDRNGTYRLTIEKGRVIQAEPATPAHLITLEQLIEQYENSPEYSVD